MTEMTHRERVNAALRGAPTDRPPISLWRHFGGIDMTASGLADAMVGFQQEYDFDFVKFMPTGTYTIIDWGAETEWVPNDHGIRTVRRLPVQRAEDWPRLPLLDTATGVLGMVNDALALAVGQLGPDVPVLQTIFSPLATARKLGGEATLAHLRRDPDQFAEGMETITAMTASLIADAVRRGADLFYVLQSGTADVLTRDEFVRWETAYARRLLAGLGDTLVVLHTHGDHLWFEDVADWPVSGINWHDRSAGPSLARARNITDRGLLGGVDAWTALRSGTPADVEATVIDAVRQGGGRLVVAPGCVIPTDSAPHLIRTARTTVERVAAAAPSGVSG